MRNFETFASGLVFLAFTIFLVNEVDGIIQKMALVLWGLCITIGAILLWKLENSMDSKRRKAGLMLAISLFPLVRKEVLQASASPSHFTELSISTFVFQE